MDCNHFSSEGQFSIRVEWKGKLISDGNHMLVVAGYAVLNNKLKLNRIRDIRDGIQSVL